MFPSHGLSTPCHINQQFSDCSPLKCTGGQLGLPLLLEVRDWVAQVLPVSICTLPSQPSWAAAMEQPSSLSGCGGALTPHQPFQQAPEGTHMWWSCCHLTSPTAGQFPEEHTSSSFQRHLPKITSLKTAPAEQSGPPGLFAEQVAGRRHPDLPSGHFSHCRCSASSL